MSAGDHGVFTVGPSADYEGRAKMVTCICGYETPAAGTTERLLELWAAHVALAMCEQITGIVNSWAADQVRR